MLNTSENCLSTKLEGRTMKVKNNAKVVEYDIETKMFILAITNEQYAVLYNNGLFEKTNTAASYVGRTIPVLLSEERNKDGYFIAEMPPDFYKAQEITYTPGTKVQGVVTTHLGYGVIVDIAWRSAFLHLTKIREVYPEIENPSEVEMLSIGRVIDAYVDSSDESGMKLTLLANETKEKPKNNFWKFLKERMAS